MCLLELKAEQSNKVCLRERGNESVSLNVLNNIWCTPLDQIILKWNKGRDFRMDFHADDKIESL